MKNLTMAAGAALLASTAMVHAGGIDRSGQSIDIIFEEGSYAEVSFGFVSPTVSGTDFTTLDTGDMSPSYSMLGAGYKMDVSEKISLAVIFDQPFGANADYPTGEFSGTQAVLTSFATTVVASYDVSDRIVVFGGAVAQSMSANADILIPTFSLDYDVVAESDMGFGYVVGGAFQIPEYALRVSLTYRSQISTTHATAEFGGAFTVPTDITTPQSINLEFQTGINPKTLIFGSVRWVEWSVFEIAPATYPLGVLVEYDNDVVTYELGVGRKLSETLSAAVTLGYEAALGAEASLLAPTDGYFSVGAGVTYKMGAAEISGGVKYLWLGDAATGAPVSSFTGNNALAVGFKISYAM